MKAFEGEVEVAKGIYPILVVPEKIRELGPVEDQSTADARETFDWTMSTLRVRTDGLLRFFEMDYPTAGSEYSFLLDFGNRMAAELRQEPNFTLTDNGAELTAPGLSMAYDSGLLIGDLVIRSSDGGAKWTLQEEGDKNRVEYHKAVLCGRPEGLRIEPVRPSIADARLIVQGLDFHMMWAWRYASCLTVLTSEVRLSPEQMLSRAHALGFPLEDYRQISKRERAKARMAGNSYLRRDKNPFPM